MDFVIKHASIHLNLSYSESWLIIFMDGAESDIIPCPDMHPATMYSNLSWNYYSQSSKQRIGRQGCRLRFRFSAITITRKDKKVINFSFIEECFVIALTKWVITYAIMYLYMFPTRTIIKFFICFFRRSKSSTRVHPSIK